MDDLVATLWAAFEAESLEHLDAVEPLIAGAETAPPGADDIAQLFRSFHSVKGLARGMDMRAMEAVAHRAETLLGQVRAGDRRLAGELVGLLLEAVDCLKSLRLLAIQERRDGTPPDGLLARLDAAAGAVPARTPAAAAQPAAQDGDPEMYRYFAEMLKAQLPALGRACAVIIDGTAADASAAARDGARGIAAELAHAAAVMEFPALAMALKAMDQPLSSGDVWALFHLLSEVEQSILVLEGDGGLDAGAADFALSLNWLRGTFAHRLYARLGERLRPLLAGAPGGAAAAEVAGDLAHCFCLFANRPRSGRAAFLLQDVLGRMRLNDLRPSPATLDAAAALAGALDPALAAGDGPENLDVLTAALRQCLFQDIGGADSEQAAAALRRHLRQERVPEELIAALSPEAAAESARLLAEGWDRTLVVEARLEKDREIAERFVQWAETEVRAVTNRAVSRDGEGWLQFLILGRDAAALSPARLQQIDPDGGSIRGSGQPVAAADPQRRDDPQGATFIRVPGPVIDRFMGQIGEMVLVRSALNLAVADENAQAARVAMRKLGDRLRAVAPGAADALTELAVRIDQIEEQHRRIALADQQLHGALKRLQEGALELRVVPIDTVFNRFPRVVRDLSQRTGKMVRLVLEGRDVRIDKGMVELLVDPLTHMVRNAIDHGLEPPAERQAAGKAAIGTVRLTGAQRGNRILVEVSDDGRGMDAAALRRKAVRQGLMGEAETAAMSDEQALRLVFLPGFSTAEEVTEMSGRGVGMDVVNTNVARLGGNIRIDSRPGEGTTFHLVLPLSAAIQEVLLVEAAGHMLAIPERFIVEVHEAERGSLRSVQGRQAILLRNEFLPVQSLAGLLGLRSEGLRREHLPILVLGSGMRRLGIAVDHLSRRQELYVKDVHPRLLALPGVGGASVLGDGRVVLILDVEGLFRLAGQAGGHAGGHAGATPLAAE